MPSKLQITASIPDDRTVKNQVIRSIIAKGGRVNSWISKHNSTDVVHLTLVCDVTHENSAHDIIRGIEEVQRAAVLGVGVFRQTTTFSST